MSPPEIGEMLIQRKYMVRVGFPVTGDLAEFPGVVEVPHGDQVLHVVPLEQFPITLTYTRDKMRADPQLRDHNGEAAVTEACERAVKVWRRDHFDEDYPVLLGFDVRPQWERELENTLPP